MIAARGLSKRYGATVAVDGLSFEVRPGVVTGFLGPNGSGKSSTMRLCSVWTGRTRARSGSVDGAIASCAGHCVRSGRCWRRRPPIRDAAPTRIWRRWLAESNAIPRFRVGEVLDLVGLSGVARRRAGGFSLGMAQRLGLAAALLGDPWVLLLDDPVNGLDPQGIRWLRGLLRSLAGHGRIVFVSSHLISEMALMAEHLVVIAGGRLVADASLAELSARTGSLEQTFLELTAGSAEYRARDS